MRDIDDINAMVRQALALLGVAEPDTAENAYSGRAGSCRVTVFIHAQPEQDRTLLQVRAEVAHDVPLSPALYEYIACRSTQYLFGALGLVPTGGGTGFVVMVHTLLGEHCTAEALAKVVAAVASTANRLDDDIVAQFGGAVSFG